MKNILLGIDIRYLIIAGLVAYIVFLQQCSRSGRDCPEIISSVSDTTRTTHIDTVPFYDTIPRFLDVSIPVYHTIDSIVLDTIKIGDTSITVKYPRNEYESKYSDSLIEGSIKITTDGYLDDQKLTYTPKFPKYINRIDSVIIDNTVTLSKQKFGVYIGADIGGGVNRFDFAPKLTLSDPKGYHYSYRYEIISKSHFFGIAVRVQPKQWIKNIMGKKLPL